MSKSFFDVIKPHILRVGDQLTAEEYVNLAEKTDELGREFGDENKPRIESIDLRKYYLTASPYNVWAERKALTPIQRNDGTAFIPSFLTKDLKALKKLYNAVIVNDIVYRVNHNKICHTSDTGRYILKENAFMSYDRQYYEHQDNLVYIEAHDFWCPKHQVVVSVDTGEKYYKGDCIKHKTEDGKVEYYRYRELSPYAKNIAARFDETKFPKQEDIKELRIGVELEYADARGVSREVLRTKDLRNKWSSVNDGSINKNIEGLSKAVATEFVSVPFKYEEGLEEVRRLIGLAKSTDTLINDTCGFHVHFGTPELNFRNLTGMVLLCENIENDLFKLMPDFRQHNRYCKKLDESFNGFKDFANKGITEEEVAEIFYEGQATASKRAGQGKWTVNDKRHYWLSIDRFWYCRREPHKRTIEFRLHHATHDADEFIEFIKLCYYIVQYGLNHTIEECQEATLMTVLDSIRDRMEREEVENLLQSRKVIN